MMNESKLRSRPPQIDSSGKDSLETFLGGAGVQLATPSESTTLPESEQHSYPWDAPNIRSDVTKVYNLRLPEPYLLKLKYIAEHTPDSMQQFCLNVLLPAIDAKINQLAKPIQR